MKKYRIEIEEVLTKVVEVKADNMNNAFDKVYERYCNEQVVLNSEDWLDTKFYVLDQFNNRICKF